MIDMVMIRMDLIKKGFIDLQKQNMTILGMMLMDSILKNLIKMVSIK